MGYQTIEEVDEALRKQIQFHAAIRHAEQALAIANDRECPPEQYDPLFDELLDARARLKRQIETRKAAHSKLMGQPPHDESWSLHGR